MQAFTKISSLVLLFITLFSCEKKPESFEEAIAKQRHTLVDQVNPVGKDVPFYTISTLNPVWTLTDQTPIVSIPKFSLLDQESAHRDETLFTGKISIVGFMFASCSGFCPFLIESMKTVEKDLLETGISAQFVALTVNPEKDTPARLKAYAQERKLDTTTRWVLLTGSKETIYSLAKKTFASQAFQRLEAQKSGEETFVHSEHLYVIDAARRLRGILNGTRLDVKKDARLILSQLKKSGSEVVK